MKLSKLIPLLQDIVETRGDMPVSSCHSNGFVEPVTGVQIIGEEKGDVLFLKSRPFHRDTGASVHIKGFSAAPKATQDALVSMVKLAQADIERGTFDEPRECGQIIVDAIIRAAAIERAEHPTPESTIFVWKANAAEQIEASLNEAGYKLVPIEP